jgi:hypothetical protein
MGELDWAISENICHNGTRAELSKTGSQPQRIAIQPGWPANVKPVGDVWGVSCGDPAFTNFATFSDAFFVRGVPAEYLDPDSHPIHIPSPRRNPPSGSPAVSSRYLPLVQLRPNHEPAPEFRFPAVATRSRVVNCGQSGQQAVACAVELLAFLALPSASKLPIPISSENVDLRMRWSSDPELGNRLGAPVRIWGAKVVNHFDGKTIGAEVDVEFERGIRQFGFVFDVRGGLVSMGVGNFSTGLSMDNPPSGELAVAQDAVTLMNAVFAQREEAAKGFEWPLGNTMAQLFRKVERWIHDDGPPVRLFVTSASDHYPSQVHLVVIFDHTWYDMKLQFSEGRLLRCESGDGDKKEVAFAGR